MNFPNLFLSKLVIPKTKYCLKYQLKCADYRINFAMNCGSMSNPPSVPVYNPLTLDAQLTRASVYYLMESVDVELKFNNGRTSSVTRDSIGAEIDVVGGGGGGRRWLLHCLQLQVGTRATLEKEGARTWPELSAHF